MNVLRQVGVYVRNRFAGTLQVTDEEYRFEYDSIYLNSPNAQAVSLTLPLRNEPYTSHVLFPFFDGLIPEGWLLNVVSRNWKISQKDRFGLLMVACHDCIGCVSLREVSG